MSGFVFANEHVRDESNNQSLLISIKSGFSSLAKWMWDERGEKMEKQKTGRHHTMHALKSVNKPDIF